MYNDIDSELIFDPTEEQCAEMKRIEDEEWNVKKMMEQDKKKKLAEESKRRKKALRKARRQVKYPQLQKFIKLTVYEIEINHFHRRLFATEHDALSQGFKMLKAGCGPKIKKIRIKPYSKSINKLSTDETSDLCPFCENICVVERSDAINRYHEVFQKNEEIYANNNQRLKEYIDKLDTKTEEILKEMNNKDNSNKKNIK